MSTKITRARLSRGTKLQDDHLFRPMREMASVLSASISTDNLKTPYATFRINLNIPEYGGALAGTILPTSSSFPELMIPFALPPLQEFFDTRGVLSSSTPNIILDEFGLSFDQRDESAIIRSSDKPANDGYFDFDEVNSDRYDLSIRLVEKNMTIFDTTQSSFVPTGEVFSTELKTTSFMDKNFRLNPFVISNLNKSINPYKSYTLFLKAPNLTKAHGTKFAFVSLNISLKFKHPLVERDIWTSVAQHGKDKLIQNIPTKHSGSHSGEVISITMPASGALIRADSSAGINSNLQLLEQPFLDKLRGGYSEDGERSVSEHISDDAAYEVIAVPMFAGLSHSIDLINGNFSRLPYVGVSPFTGSTCDRRIIPIINPFVLHHVIAARNWGTTPDQRNMKPTGSQFGTEISVGIGTGMQGDNFGYQEVAYANFSQTTTGSYLIDKIKQSAQGQMTLPQGNLASQNFDSELFHVPLVYFKDKNQTKHLGTSYPLTGSGVYTGNPVYIGKSWLGTEQRSEIATTASGSAGYSKVSGQEQWIECRWKFGDATNGLSSSVHGSYQTQNIIFQGYGGNWLYLIGKKLLTGLDDDG